MCLNNDVIEIERGDFRKCEKERKRVDGRAMCEDEKGRVKEKERFCIKRK